MNVMEETFMLQSFKGLLPSQLRTSVAEERVDIYLDELDNICQYKGSRVLLGIRER